MRRLVFALLTACAVLAAALSGGAARADDPVDLSGLGGQDLRVLQAALILRGDYSGALDGSWGPRSQAALARYARREHGAETPRASDLTALVAGFEHERRGAGWTVDYFPGIGLSLAQPIGMLHPETSIDGHLTLRSRPEGLILRRMQRGRLETAAMHDWAQRSHRGPSRPYQVLGDRQMVSSVELEGRTKLYLRSELVGDRFATVLVQGEPSQARRYALVTASLRRGPQPALVIQKDGGLAALLGRAAAPSSEPARVVPMPRPEPPPEVAALAPEVEAAPQDDAPAEAAEAVEDPAKPTEEVPPVAEVATEDSEAPVDEVATEDSEPPVAEETPEVEDAPVYGDLPVAEGVPPEDGEDYGEFDEGPLTSSGTGFFVSPTAMVTAAHVVRDCVKVKLIDGTPLTLQAEDPLRDLAVLEAASPSEHWLELQDDNRPRLGQTVAAVGFPFYGLAGEDLVLTTGNISSIMDAEAAADRIMISAPVQPGNSGGPLLSADGEVVGMVAARADDAFFLEMTGTMPQAMNFAVRLGALRKFLVDAGVALPGNGAAAMPLTDGLAEDAQQAIRPVLCELPDEF